jgi:exo-beta-1,3-glucanase (GH17 family)
MTSTKALKMQVIELVVDVVVARGGRFLLIQMTEGTWVDGGQKQGKAEPGHAMRDTFRRKAICIPNRESTPKNRW